jgi:hypothetical protein
LREAVEFCEDKRSPREAVEFCEDKRSPREPICEQ